MTDYAVTPFSGGVVIGATGIVSILQNVRTILGTMQGTVPMDRPFGRDGGALDRPLTKAMAGETASIYRAIHAYEPRVEIVDISFEHGVLAAGDGRLTPRVTIRIKEEAR